MARKRNPAPTPPEPDAVVAAPPEPAPPKVADMPIRDLLQMLGRTQPEGTPLPPGTPSALPVGIDAEARIADLTAGDLLKLLTAFRG